MINLNPFAKKEETKVTEVTEQKEAELKPRKCKECQNDFSPTRKDRVFCSDKCRARFNVRDYRSKHIAKNPNWSAERQREYRAKHPEMFAKIMARYHLRKMTYEARHQLIEEVDAQMKS